MTVNLQRALALACCAVSPLFVGAERPPLEVPRVEWTGPPAQIRDAGEDVRWGYLVVPERRPATATGRTIRLPFAILGSLSSAPLPDPVLHTTGGPGGSSLYALRRFRTSPIREDRDLIILEQRGTRFAEPALMCSGIDEALRSGWDGGLDGAADPDRMRVAVRSCATAARAAGVDLAGYTTEQIAQDVADLRRALGIPQWNLYGVSYSTKVMLTAARDRPEGIRAMILDSVLPLEVNADEEAPRNIWQVLEHVFASCEKEPALSARFPDLKRRFLALVRESNRRPLRLVVESPLNRTPVQAVLDGVGITNVIYTALEDSTAVPRVPLLVDAFLRNDVSRVAPFVRGYLGSSQGTAWGMRIAVWCNEEWPFMSRTQILRPPGVPEELARFSQPQIPIEAFQVWPVASRPAARENQPVRTSIPTLIVSGEFDPDTPTAWARRVASSLPNAQLVEIPGYSHAPLYGHPAAARLLREFLADPSHKPSASEGLDARTTFAVSWEQP